MIQIMKVLFPNRAQRVSKQKPKDAPKRKEADESSEKQYVLKWLKQVRFKRKLFGGVDEADVWKKITVLNDLYEKVWVAERVRYDALLAERTSAKKPVEVQNIIEKTETEKAGDETCQ